MYIVDGEYKIQTDGVDIHSLGQLMLQFKQEEISRLLFARELARKGVLNEG